MIDVLGRTPALAQAVSRLLPFLTYGRKAAAGLLADKFAQVRLFCLCPDLCFFLLLFCHGVLFGLSNLSSLEWVVQRQQRVPIFFVLELLSMGQNRFAFELKPVVQREQSVRVSKEFRLGVLSPLSFSVPQSCFHGHCHTPGCRRQSWY